VILVQQARNWLVPRSTNRDEAFREKTIRATISITIVLLSMSLFITDFIFKDDWALVSYRSLISTMLITAIASAVSVAVHHSRNHAHNPGRFGLEGALRLVQDGLCREIYARTGPAGIRTGYDIQRRPGDDRRDRASGYP
jgi:hypothetical protein